MKRRTFLAALVPSPAAPIRLAFGTYGAKQLSNAEVLRLLGGIGYDGVQLSLIPGWPADPVKLEKPERAEVRKLLSGLGLKLCALQESLPMIGTPEKRAYNLTRLKMAAEVAHDLAPDAPPCLDTIIGLKTAEWDNVRGRMVDELGEWARIGESAGMTIAIKPHADQAVDTPGRAVWMLGQVRSKRVRLVYDYSHMFLAGLSIEESLKTLLPHTAHVAVKDARQVGTRHEYLLPGDGGTDYVALFRTLGAMNYRGAVAIEVSSQIHGKPGYDAAATARLCYERMAGAMKRAGVRG